MCSHTQAAALSWNVKSEYWRFLESSKKVGTSLDKLSKHGLPSGSGKKENQIRRGSSNANRSQKSSSTVTVNLPDQPQNTSTNNHCTPQRASSCANQGEMGSTYQIPNQRPTVSQQIRGQGPASLQIRGQGPASLQIRGQGPHASSQIRGQGRGCVYPCIANQVNSTLDIGLPILPTPVPIPYPAPQMGHFWLYLLQFCPKAVCICFGCSQSLKINGNICQPPHDLVIVSNMYRNVTVNGQQWSKRSNVYFHVNEACVKKKQPLFEFRYLYYPPDVVKYFDQVHVQFFALHGIRL